MIKNNLTWFVKIPDSIEPGNYILRHEIIGLHAAGSANGAQNYPFCFNLAISSSGTDKPAGVLGTELYSSGMPGIVWDLFRKQTSYPIPGVSPPLSRCCWLPGPPVRPCRFRNLTLSCPI